MTEQARPVGRVIEAGGGSFIALVDRALAKYPDIGDPVWIADPQFLDALPERNGPLTDSHTLRLILELIESIQDKLEGIEEKLDDQRHMLAAADVERHPAPQYKRSDELELGDYVWWGQHPATIADAYRCCGANADSNCWFVESTDERTIHCDPSDEWRIATPGERMGFE